ncbi:MAG: ankyrin repeat domain-containing protein [Verrucomicrobiota bacterium]|nr:ankyrin repeat domain-containing protein [Verrucomicrobiota bacterium]
MKHILIKIVAVLLLGCGESVPEISIHDAAEQGNIKAVKQHIAAGANVNRFLGGWSCLDRASHKGYIEIARLLIDNGANVNARIEGLFDHPGKSPLDYSTESKHKEISKLLRQHGAKTSEELDAEKK